METEKPLDLKIFELSSGWFNITCLYFT